MISAYVTSISICVKNMNPPFWSICGIIMLSHVFIMMVIEANIIRLRNSFPCSSASFCVGVRGVAERDMVVQHCR